MFKTKTKNEEEEADKIILYYTWKKKKKKIILYYTKKKKKIGTFCIIPLKLTFFLGEGVGRDREVGCMIVWKGVAGMHVGVAVNG